jgi:hypothetical protein
MVRYLPGAFVLRQRVIERDFLLAEARFLASLPSGLDVLGQLDQFFQDLRRGDGIDVVARNSGDGISSSHRRSFPSRRPVAGPSAPSRSRQP